MARPDYSTRPSRTSKSKGVSGWIQGRKERKRALAEQTARIITDDTAKNETLEEKRERLLKSTDPKELYKDRDLLSYQELNERVNRIDLETRLNSRIPAEPQRKTGAEYMEQAKNNIDKAVWNE